MDGRRLEDAGIAALAHAALAATFDVRDLAIIERLSRTGHRNLVLRARARLDGGLRSFIIKMMSAPAGQRFGRHKSLRGMGTGAGGNGPHAACRPRPDAILSACRDNERCTEWAADLRGSRRRPRLARRTAARRHGRKRGSSASRACRQPRRKTANGASPADAAAFSAISRLRPTAAPIYSPRPATSPPNGWLT